MSRFCVAALIGAFALPAYAQVYRCEHAGRVIYSQTPCATGEERQLDLPPAKPSRGTPEWAKQQVENDPRVKALNERLTALERAIDAQRKEHARTKAAWLNDNQTAPEHIRQAVERNQVVIGMAADAVIASIGHPDDSTRHVFPSGTTEWWHYHRDPGGLSIHFRSSRVDSIHER